MKTKKKNVLFTFDYELFLGKRSGSVMKCCIEPTEILLKIFEQYSIKHVIFFVDTSYLLQLRANDTESSKQDFKFITEQLQQLIKKGHYIFPHIHSHWLDAIYLTQFNQWDLSNNSRYRFNQLTANQREDLFKESLQILYDIILPVNSEYRIDSYRAGGWCIQPFSDFEAVFAKHQIVNDFSVLRGMANESKIQNYDFTHTPQSDIYPFENDPLIIDEKGKYREHVISVIDIPRQNQFLNKILLKVLWKLNQRSIGDGIGSETAGVKSSGVKNNLKEMVSIELLTKVRLPLYFKHIEANEFIQFISHPKMLSYYNIKIFKKFLSKFTKHYKFETDYKKMAVSARG